MRLGLLIYGSLDTLSGGYLYDRRLVEYLRSQGDTVQIISLPWRNYLAHLTDNFTFRLPPGLDLLIQDELNHPSLLAANARPHPYPVVSLVHHQRHSEQHPASLNAVYRAVERGYLRGVDGFIFNSQTTRRLVENLLDEPKPGVIAHPPVDRFGLRVTEAEAARRAGGGELRLLFLGNVIPRKGLHTLLAALRELRFPFRLDVAGSLSMDPAYARRMQALAAGLPVTFHGALEDAALAGLMSAAHLLTVPSFHEGFGIVYLEGMGFGLPAIGGRQGAAEEVITDGEDGFLIPPEDAHMLAERLRLLASDRARLARMGAAALRRYSREPVWEDSAASIRSFLQKML